MQDREQEVLARIDRGEFYTESEAAFQAPLRRADLIFEYNHTRPSDTVRRRGLLEAILGSVGARTVLHSPFHAGFGSNVHIGDDFFGNVNVTFVDDAPIRIGYGSVIGAGSVVTHDIPTLSVAVGAPCRVIRAIIDADLTPKRTSVSRIGRHSRTATGDPQ